MRKLIIILAVVSLVLVGQQRKSAPKPPKPTPKVEQYNPDNLPWGEMACGRPESRRSIPCKCIEHRLKAHDEAQEMCEKLGDKKAVLNCLKLLPSLCEIPVVDVDHAPYNLETGERMPAQCSRSCSKAHCECCRS